MRRPEMLYSKDQKWSSNKQEGRETWGQTGRTPVISSQSGNHKIKTKPSVVRRRIFSVTFLLWLDCRVS
ncbi:MAG TPA: hypothetical protein VE377_14095, partial [Candidatus Dormibacteraeota bacterium]|nr:hypothetical protein [Candidatus Dormibacteraeota bacterium]